MRKFTLLLMVLAITGMSYGQVLKKAQDALVKQSDIPVQLDKTPFKAGGDTIWHTTFGWADETNERGWTLPEGWTIQDDSGFGMPWVWRDDTIRGNYTNISPRTYFDSEEDGFMVAPIDEYNSVDGQTQSNGSDTWFETPEIDCSAASSVVVTFWHFFRLCCSDYNLEMMVTFDGIRWAIYDVRYGTAGNTTTPDRFLHPEINITDVAAGQPSVKIRFRIHGPSHYYWIIDDLTLTEAYDNDLILEDVWADFNGGFDDRIGHINYIPMTQIGAAVDAGGNIGDYSFRGALLNSGMLDQENAMVQMTILKNGEQTYQDVSEPTLLWPLDRDTLTVVSNFLADDYGDYQFNFEAISDNAEEVPVNNVSSLRFTVTDSLYHRADFSAEASANTGGWVGGSNAGDEVGVGYDLFQPTEINSITALIAGVTDAQFPTYQYVLKKYLVEEDLYVDWISSDIYDADSTKAWTWQTHLMEKDGETEFLEPGFYWACVRMWGDDGTEEGSNGLSIGWDKDNKWNGWYTYMFQAVGGGEYSTGKMNMIGMVFNEQGGPTEAPVTFNVDMNAHIANGEFNPEWDFVDVAGTFNDWNGSEALTDEDGDGIFTITLDGMPVGEVIEFKYRINANWDTSEFPLGGPNRTYTVRYWNVLNNVYNGGETTGVTTMDLVESFKVYPNPTRSDFTVQVTNKTATDVTVTLMDIQGHVVYQNTAHNVVSHTETIDNNFAKGVYFVTIQSGAGVKVQKLIIQ